MKRFILFMIIVLWAAGMAEAREITLSIVYNNVAGDEELTLSWGMACIIEGTEKEILFDTGGDGRILLANIRCMGIDPGEIDAVVLSHIHGDHTGGLEVFLAENPAVALYIPASFPENFKRRVKAKAARVIEVRTPVEICDRVHSTGELGTGMKEQALVLESGKGLILITGCAHPGVTYMVKSALDLFDNVVYLVTGGFHLGGANANEIEGVVSELKNIGVRKIGPSHCTGELATEKFRKVWGKDFVEAGCGAVIAIPD
jgi:7,8-dihydropterin-6-yl-methyl-4-(beta-D-ribofuranosyl)aminobenzene 5'-phosphate synthase